MKGIGVSPGISIGKAFVIKNKVHSLTGMMIDSQEAALSELEKFDRAVKISISEVEGIIANPDLNLQAEEIEILETQIEFLSDPQIRSDVIHEMENEHTSAHDSLIVVVNKFVTMFKSMEDEYMSGRSADIQDIGNRLLRHLNTSYQAVNSLLEKDTIIIADDISPSDTITMDLEHVIGFATRIGSKTSHTAILAKAKGIPAVVGCGDKISLIKNNDIIILDGKTGHVLINPDSESLSEYIRLRTEHARMTEALKSLMDVSAVTADGIEIELLGNISNAEDLDDVFENGGQGVGLFRTEMLFLGQKSYPSEETQFEFYKTVAVNSKDEKVIIRTLDIGGDKKLNYFDLPKEQNPFLGYRAIRICIDRPDLFITQLKAILRASIFGNFKIMFPMISGITELRQAKEILEIAKEELRASNVVFDESIEVGIMVEIPSAAITADILAKEVDFFSIGTNDLCQYTLAVDRMNEKMEYLYDPYNPGVLRLIKNVIEQADKHNIKVGMCGEMASDPQAVRLLLGFGLKEFSMSPGSIAEVKAIILNTTMQSAKDIGEKVLLMDSSENIKNFLAELDY